MLKLGAVFPMEFGNDPLLTHEFVKTIEVLGYDYIQTYEGIVNTPSADAPMIFQEPFTLLSHLAALSDKLELATGITVLSSRQTVLAAKQIAMVDLLCRGRLRLGVSTGSNETEYAAQGIDYASRGKRLNEQIPLLRRLWTEDYVTFDGAYHTLDNVGIFPKPKQQPVPIWVGGYADAVLRRVAKLSDGWLADANEETLDTVALKFETVKRYAEEAGRNPADIGLELVDVPIQTERDWVSWVQQLEGIGASYMAVTTRHAKPTTTKEHLDYFAKFIGNWR
jgi:probable F420-dependent oxidoreductase